MINPVSIIIFQVLLLIYVAAADRNIVIGQDILLFGRDQYPSYWRDVEEWSRLTGVINGSKPLNSDKDFGIHDADSIVEESDCGGCNCDAFTAYCGCSGTVRNCRVVMENTGGNIESCDTQSCSETVSYTQTQSVSNSFSANTDIQVFDKMKFGATYTVQFTEQESFSDSKTVTLAKGETCTWISLKAYVECDVFNKRYCMPIYIPPHDCTPSGGCERTTVTRTLVNYDEIINCYKPIGGVGTTTSGSSSTLSNVLVVQ